MFGTLWGLFLPGCLVLFGCLLLGLLGLAFLRRGRQRLIAEQDQPAALATSLAGADQNQSAAPAGPVTDAELRQPRVSAEFGPPAFDIAPPSMSQPAGASDADALFAFAAARLVSRPGTAANQSKETLVSPPPADLAPTMPLDAVASASGESVLEPEARHDFQAAKASAATAEAPSERQQFPYRLGESLGQGIGGMLYYAEAIQSQQPKAIKLLSSRFFRRPRARKLFLQRASGLTLLEDPYLLPVEEIGIQWNRGYLVQPYLSGGNLLDRLETPLTLQATWRYLKPLVKAVEYLHECQVTHLHLSPENILFDEADHLWVSDAGLFGLLMELARESGASFSIPLSPFVAPEQWVGRADWRSDLYALGALLYGMLVGREALLAQGEQPLHPPFLQAIRPDLPWTLEEVLAQALAENPEARYQSAEALALAFYTAVRPGSGITSNQGAVERAGEG